MTPLGDIVRTLPVIDQHCHSILRSWADPGLPPTRWRRCFTEAGRDLSFDRDVPHMTGYREFLEAFARFGLASSAEETAVAGRRDALAAGNATDYLRRLMADAGAVSLLIDTGFGGSTVFDPTELAGLIELPVHEIIRLEPLLERLLGTSEATRSAAAFGDALGAALDDVLAAGAVGFKSAAAYRSGLRLARPTTAAIERALEDRAAQASRVTDPALIALAMWSAAERGAQRDVPLQIHVGFGDEDLDLPDADPALLRALFRDSATDRCPVVLLHAHPFIASAAYLASIYPQVYLDLSLTIPLLGGAAARRAIAEALALCPTSKLVAASDGHSQPEMHWRGLTLWREALTDVLDAEIEADRLTEDGAVAIARDVLACNARRLYRLPPTSV